VLHVLAAFGAEVRDRNALVATTAGTLRPARATGGALLDLAELGPGVILCPDFEREGWDAPAVAAGLSEHGARAPGLEFLARPCGLLRHPDELALTDADVAARFDDDARLAWTAAQLRSAVADVGRCVGVLLPPWLGARAPRARALSEAVGVPCGELVGLPPHGAGVRFSQLRDAALAKAGVEVLRGWARAVRGGEVLLEEGPPLAAPAVVLALGGLVGGGLRYTPAEAMLAAAYPPHARLPFSLGLDANASVGEGGRPFPVPGSLHGLAPESLAWPTSRRPVLERAGVLVDDHFSATPGVWACGELVADQPRTWIAAVRSGVAAGAAASTWRTSLPAASRTRP
jgi:glycerol-3-phosphate dehydrogenase subunit B